MICFWSPICIRYIVTVLMKEPWKNGATETTEILFWILHSCDNMNHHPLRIPKWGEPLLCSKKWQSYSSFGKFCFKINMCLISMILLIASSSGKNESIRIYFMSPFILYAIFRTHFKMKKQTYFSNGKFFSIFFGRFPFHHEFFCPNACSQ